jgi:hypothetical protein
VTTLSQYLARTFKRVKAEPDPQTTARTLARATTIVGLMLEDMGDRYSAAGKVSGPVLRAGRIGWLLVELAAPRSLGRVLFNHWVAIGWLSTLVVLAIGFVFDNGEAVTIGGRMAAVVAALQLGVDVLNRWMRRARLGPAWAVCLAALAVVVLLGGWMAYIDYEMVRNGARLSHASVFAGKIVTHNDAVALLGPQNFDLMHRSLRIDVGFIASYVLLLVALGAAVGAVRPLAAAALVLAGIDLLEDYQVLRALDPAGLTPFVWYLKVGATVFALAAIVWAIVDRLRARASRGQPTG